MCFIGGFVAFWMLETNRMTGGDAGRQCGSEQKIFNTMKEIA